jgi:hypothetical protein
VKISTNIYLDKENIFKKNDFLYVMFCGYEFYIPDVVCEKITRKLSS